MATSPLNNQKVNPGNTFTMTAKDGKTSSTIAQKVNPGSKSTDKKQTKENVKK